MSRAWKRANPRAVAAQNRRYYERHKDRVKERKRRRLNMRRPLFDDRIQESGLSIVTALELSSPRFRFVLCGRSHTDFLQEPMPQW